MRAERPPRAALRIDRSSDPRRTISASTLAIIFGVLVLGAIAWWWLARPKPIAVRTITARELSSAGPTTLLNATGYVTARRAATVSSKVTGKILEILVEVGRRVEVGEVLARVDSSNAEASLRRAQAQLETTRQTLAETDANLAMAELDFRRQRELAEKKTISPSD